MSSTGVPSSRSTPPKVSTTPPRCLWPAIQPATAPAGSGEKGLRLANTPTRSIATQTRRANRRTPLAAVRWKTKLSQTCENASSPRTASARSYGRSRRRLAARMGSQPRLPWNAEPVPKRRCQIADRREGDFRHEPRPQAIVRMMQQRGPVGMTALTRKPTCRRAPARAWPSPARPARPRQSQRPVQNASVDALPQFFEQKWHIAFQMSAAGDEHRQHDDALDALGERDLRHRRANPAA
jgi:hypothetical protein